MFGQKAKTRWPWYLIAKPCAPCGIRAALAGFLADVGKRFHLRGLLDKEKIEVMCTADHFRAQVGCFGGRLSAVPFSYVTCEAAKESKQVEVGMGVGSL